MSQPEEHIWIRETRAMLEWVDQQIAKAEAAKKTLQETIVPATLPPQFTQDIDFVANQTSVALGRLQLTRKRLENRLKSLEGSVTLQGPNAPRPKVDLELKNLGQYYGSDTIYQDRFGGRYTEGVRYIMQNGYAWFVTDALAVIRVKPMFRAQPFVVVRLELKPDVHVLYDDGNNHVLFEQQYKMSDAKVPIKLYYENGVLMLPNER